MKTIEDKSIVAHGAWGLEKLETLDDDAKHEGKCLYRPNFVQGDINSRVTLWANYFPVTFDSKKLSGLAN